jgi:hypothetical protein
MFTQKPGIPFFLFHGATGDLVGIKDTDGGESLFPGATFTWDTLPAPGRHPGSMVRVSDIGVAPGILMVSDGTRWIAAGPQILARSAAPVVAPVDTNENILVTINVPEELLGINGILRITPYWSTTNNANVKTLRARFSGIGGTALLSVNAASGSAAMTPIIVANRNAANSQYAMGLSGATVNSVNGPAVNTLAATTVVITAQKATAGDTVQLDAYLVEVLP